MEQTITKDEIEGNKLIAVFMDGEVQHENMVYFKYWQDHHRYFKLVDLKYHTSWNWLMPVIEKIAKLSLTYENVDEQYSPYPTTFGMLDQEGNYMVRLYCNPVFAAEKLIEAAWLAVVDFLQWYVPENAARRIEAEPKNV